MDDVRNDVIIAHPFKTDPRIFGVWHKYSDAIFVIATAPYCKDFILIATIFSVVINLYSCGVLCLNHVKYRHVNS